MYYDRCDDSSEIFQVIESPHQFGIPKIRMDRGNDMGICSFYAALINNR
jgi:hypothetical protein